MSQGFKSEQAVQLAKAFDAENVDYLFIEDFVQIESAPFKVDIIFAPDGIASFAEAKARSLQVEGFRIANLRDIIASKRASGREKDFLDLEYLERFPGIRKNTRAGFAFGN